MADPDSQLNVSNWSGSEVRDYIDEPSLINDDVFDATEARNDGIINDRNNAVDNKINTDNHSVINPRLFLAGDQVHEVLNNLERKEMAVMAPAADNQLSVSQSSIQQPDSIDDGIDWNNSCRQLPSELICYVHDIFKTNPEHLMDVGGRETDLLQDEINRLRCPDLPGHEVPNTRNSTMATQNAILHPGTNKFHNWILEELTTFLQQREFLPPGGKRLGGSREYRKTRNERTSNPSEEHKRKIRQESIGSYKKRNEDEKKQLDECKSQLEAMIKSQLHENNERSDNRPNPDDMEDEAKYQQKLDKIEFEQILLKTRKNGWQTEKKKIDFGSFDMGAIDEVIQKINTEHGEEWDWPDDFKKYIDMVKERVDLQNLLLRNGFRSLPLMEDMIMVHALDKLYKKEENRFHGQKSRTKKDLERVKKINDVKTLKSQCEQSTSSRI